MQRLVNKHFLSNIFFHDIVVRVHTNHSPQARSFINKLLSFSSRPLAPGQRRCTPPDRRGLIIVPIASSAGGQRHCNAAAFASLKKFAALIVFNADQSRDRPEEAAYATTGYTSSS